MGLPISVDNDRCPPRFSLLIRTFVFLGVAARVSRYLLRFPLWGDEACLAVNFIDRGYAELLRPLDYFPVAPLLFLWAEKTIVRLFGFTEYSLRLFPTICSVGSVFLFLHVARRLLTGVPLLLAVAFFSVAYYPIRHGAEVKPYAADLTVSLMLTALALEWIRAPARSRWLWCLAAFVPAAVGLSYPAVFVAAGASLALLIPVLKTRDNDVKVAYAVYALALAGSFAAFFFISTSTQLDFELNTLHGGHMFKIWAHTFPPLTRPRELLLWLLLIHTGRMFAYPVGGENGGSVLTLICFISGAWFLFRRREGAVLSLFLAPFGLAFIAAALHRYPYGYSARWMLYLAPVVCILAGLGAARLLMCFKGERARRLIAWSCAALLLLIGAGGIARDVIRPYKEREDLISRDFARSFWNDMPAEKELICAKTDLAMDFFPGLFLSDHNSARYLCNQRIYSPRHREGRAPPEPGSGRTFLVVLYKVPGYQLDKRAFSRRLTDMKSRYRIRKYEEYEVNPDSPKHRECYDVYEFTPSPGESPALQRSWIPGQNIPQREKRLKTGE